MDIEKWQKIEEAVTLVSEMPAENRDAWLDEFCAGDPELLEEIESLLSFEAGAENFLEKSVTPYTAQILPENESNFSGKQFGKYKIIKEIGHGGMGAVFLAIRADGEFDQQVALKIVRQTVLDSEMRNSFRRERQILASLNHPNIARLLDGGVSDAGEPFLAMEYIEGENLLEFAENGTLSIEKRLKLFLKICSAAAFAHRSLIIHRDIKPSNILVTEYGEPKLLDFGLAKVLDFESDAAQTATAFRAMTPAYASPEQMRGESVTTASDVYSLGVVLYELLSGRRPFNFENKNFDEILRLLSTSEPVRPSDAKTGQRREAPEDTDKKTRVQKNGEETGKQITGENREGETKPPGIPNDGSAAAAAASPPPQRPGFSRSQLKGDLDNIVMMALRKEPERRYKSVGEFADDIERYLTGLPITARPNTFRYRTEKFISRNKAAAAAAVFVFLAIISGLIVALWQTNVARRQRDIANQQKIKAERINKFLHEMLSFSNQSITSVSPVAQTKNVTVNEMLDEIAPRVETELADQPEERAQILRTIGSAYASQGVYDKAEKNYRSALETQRQIFGEENAETAATMSELGLLSYRQGKLFEANELLEKAVGFYQKQQQMQLPEFSPAKLALAMDYLGVVKLYLGDAAAASSMLSAALQIASDADFQGNDRAVLLFIKSDYGGFLITMGEIEKGETLVRESLAGQNQADQKPRWETAVSLMMLGISAVGKNQPDEALQYLNESEQILRKTLGDNNVYLGNNLQHQAIALSLKKDFKTAEQKARASLDSYPVENGFHVFPKLVLATILAKDNRFNEAEPYLREVLRELESRPIRNHPGIVETKIYLGEGLLVKNNLSEAENLLLAAYTEARENFGEQSPYAKMAGNDLVKIYEKQGKKDMADKYR